jgi:hypothetical protein
MGKRGLFACRYIPRDLLTGIITPDEEITAGSICSYWRLLFASGTTSAVSSTWYILAGIPVALYLSVFTCREKAYIAMQKEVTWMGQFNMRLGI